MKVAILTTDNREPFKQYDLPAPWFGTAPEALLQGLASCPDAEVHVVSCIRRRIPSPEKLAPNIFFHSLVVPKAGWMSTLFLGCVLATRKKLRELGPAIVHGQGTEEYCSLAAVLSGMPNVLTIHGNMRLIAKVERRRPFSYPWLAARLEGVAVPRSQGVVCITSYTREAMRGLAQRTWVVPNAVDSSFFAEDARPPAEAPPRILCVGRVCERKNQNAFIRALEPLAAKQQFELVFLGPLSPGRPYDDEFLALVRARAWCRHDGFANRERLKAFFQEASLLALPSLEDNCPMVVLEAMAAGVPVMAAKVGGVPDLIEEQKTGLFCDPLDAASMKGAVEKILSNPPAAWEMARRAKTAARERFHPTVIARRHLQIYSELSSAKHV